jgi:hypothetical protein
LTPQPKSLVWPACGAVFPGLRDQFATTFHERCGTGAELGNCIAIELLSDEERVAPDLSESRLARNGYEVYLPGIVQSHAYINERIILITGLLVIAGKLAGELA